MTHTVHTVNTAIFVLFLVLYSYQLFYLLVGLVDKLRKKPLPPVDEYHHLVMVVCARNEEAVIGHLLDSFNAQRYPKDRCRAVVVADNCTDATADVARAHGATVYERFNNELVGKGFALEYAFTQLLSDENAEEDEAYIVIDADNLLTSTYLHEMNRMIEAGYVASTSYRNSKNYGDNWITAGYGLWFLREAEYLNRPRKVLGTSCAVSGTGFLIIREIIEQQGGWPFHTLTEDIEFTVATVLKDKKIGYAQRAMLYDEQPATFAASWRQRKRWAKGFYQVLWHYGRNMLKTIIAFHKLPSTRFGSFDMIMTIMPALFVTLLGLLFNCVVWIYALFNAAKIEDIEVIAQASTAVLMFFAWFYGVLFFIGVVTMITEHKNIHGKWWMKLKSVFTFPLFMFTYIPIAVAALFMKVEWEPIVHNVSKSIDEMK